MLNGIKDPRERARIYGRQEDHPLSLDQMAEQVRLIKCGKRVKPHPGVIGRYASQGARGVFLASKMVKINSRPEVRVTLADMRVFYRKARKTGWRTRMVILPEKPNQPGDKLDTSKLFDDDKVTMGAGVATPVPPSEPAFRELTEREVHRVTQKLWERIIPFLTDEVGKRVEGRINPERITGQIMAHVKAGVRGDIVRLQKQVGNLQETYAEVRKILEDCVRASSHHTAHRNLEQQVAANATRLESELSRMARDAELFREVFRTAGASLDQGLARL